MAVHETLCYVGILFLATSQAKENTSAGGVFNFETSEITNETFLVKEGTSVNITFSVQRNNSGEIDISKSDETLKIFTPQCKILPTCQPRQSYNKVFCQCLDTPGFYRITFIADRKDNALWKWSSKPDVQDVNIYFNVIYPANITRLEMVGYDTYIPRFKSVSVVCTWENGNPSTRVVLRDSHNRVLAASDTSGNVSYIYSHIECSQAGVIRCEADGSEQNMSTTLLVECPPQFVKKDSQYLINDQDADVTVQFRSHTLNISSCHIGQSGQNTNGDTNQSPKVFFACTKADVNESDVIGENKHCLYSVNGEPPDLHLNIRFRNLKRKDGGLWYVNISNDVGSDIHYIQMTIKAGSDPRDVEVNTGQDPSSSPVLSPFVIGGIVIGAATFIIIVFIIIYLIQRGRDSYARLRRKGKNGRAFYKGLDPDKMLDPQTLSGIYFEIPDAYLESDLQPTAQQSSNNCLHLVESMNDNSLENVGRLQHPYEEIEKCKFPDDSKCNEQIKKENTPRSLQNTLDYLEPIVTENQTVHLPPASNYLNPVSTGETSNVQQRPDYLKLYHAGSETSNGNQRPEYLKLDNTGRETGNVPQRSEYLKLDKTGSETNKVEGRPEYLKFDNSCSETGNVPQRSEYLKLDNTGSETGNVPQRSEYQKLDHTRHETGSTKQRTKYLKLDHTLRKTNNVTEKSDFPKVAQTDSETNSEGLRSDYLKPIPTGN